MRRKPNRELTEEQEQAADEFITGASQPPPSTTSDGDKSGSGEEDGDQASVYPWEKPRVREDVKQTYPLRLPEPLHLKLKFLSEKTGRSMNELCNKAVKDLIDEEIEEVL